MKKPVIKKGPLERGDCVEIIKADKSHDCLYVGNLGVVVRIENGQPVVHFKCGHLLSISPNHLKRTGIDWRILRNKNQLPPTNIDSPQPRNKKDVADGLRRRSTSRR